jgi:hypothetical protein
MQRKLSLWAEQDKERKFYGLYDLLYDKDWLRLAHDHVKQNAGSVTAGCDGIDMESFDENLEDNLQKIIQGLKTETFEPYPVRRVYIPKSNGRYALWAYRPLQTGLYKKRYGWFWNPSTRLTLVNTPLASDHVAGPWMRSDILFGAPRNGRNSSG